MPGVNLVSGARTRTNHVGIAEQGKVLALNGQFAEALRHYREALRLAVAAGEPEVVFRHYTTCVVECLEHAGAWNEVLSWCDRVIAHYAASPPPNPLAVRDLASTYERRAMVLVKAGRPEEAKADLAAALRLEPALPLAKAVSGWLRSGLTVDARRLRQEQDRHRYFSVRADVVSAERAVSLPSELEP